MKIAGRTIVVTGASRGIGKAAADALARSGGRLALLARSPDIEAVAAEITARGGVARGYVADVGDARDVEAAARKIVSDLGQVDIVVNNAGAGRWLHVEETPAEEVLAMMAAPYLAAFYVTRAFLPSMLERAEGYIVNVNSPVAWLTWPGATGYAAARWAMRGFTQSLRLDLRGTGIKVLEIVPAQVASTYFQHNARSEERLPKLSKLVPTLTPDQVAAVLVRGIEHDRSKLVFPLMLKFLMLARVLAPPIVDWMVWRTGARRSSHTRKE